MSDYVELLHIVSLTAGSPLSDVNAQHLVAAAGRLTQLEAFLSAFNAEWKAGSFSNLCKRADRLSGYAS